MSESKHPIASVINQIIAVILFCPSVSLTLTVPSAFLLFGPAVYTDLFLKNPNIPEKLNPWIGLIFLYFGSGFVVYMVIILLRIVFHGLILWYRRNYSDNYY